MKYIADLPERYIEKRPDGEEWLQMPVNVSGHELMIKTVIPLTPYTDLDMEQVRNEAYEDGYKTAKVQCNIQAEKDLREVGERHYQKGLSDAWDAARKITRLTVAERVRLFNGITTEGIFISFSAQSIIYKIRQYEQEQEVIEFGDEIEFNDREKALVIDVSDEGLSVMTKRGFTHLSNWQGNVIKTGVKCVMIAEYLKKMHEEKE